MADQILPITLGDIITPYNISPIEAADIVVAASGRSTVVRRGGFVFAAQLNIKPINILSSANRFWEIVTFLNSNAIFTIPCHNIAPSGVPSGVNVQVAAIASVGEVAIEVNTTGYTFNPGQYIKFDTGHTKLYQVMAHQVGATDVITLSQPLVQNLTTSNRVVFEAQPTTEYYGNTPLDGVMGLFINEDYGSPQHRIEDGILGRVNPLALREKV